MTSQQEASEALAIYQSHPRAVAESLLDQFFNRIRADEYEDILVAVREEMGKCGTTSFASSLPSSAPDLDDAKFWCELPNV